MKDCDQGQFWATCEVVTCPVCPPLGSQPFATTVPLLLWSHDSCCPNWNIPFCVFLRTTNTLFRVARSRTRWPLPCEWGKALLSPGPQAGSFSFTCEPTRNALSWAPPAESGALGLGPSGQCRKKPFTRLFRPPSGVRTGLLLGPASTVGAWLWDVSTDELFRTPS